MKKVLIVGSGSFIARSFVSMYGDSFDITGISSRDGFDGIDFSPYDSILYCSGAVHLFKKTPREYFFSLNSAQPADCAKRASAAGVGQFVFLSSMSVYGVRDGNITKDSPVNPQALGAYAMSKAEGEQKILSAFTSGKTALIRPPMVYGCGCKGNFTRLCALADKTPVFPDIHNERSMIYVENLCNYLETVIADGNGGVFHPQDSEYVVTSDMMREIARVKERNIHFTKIFNPAVRLCVETIPIFTKLFGSITYEKSLSDDIGRSYCTVGFEESIRKSIKL